MPIQSPTPKTNKFDSELRAGDPLEIVFAGTENVESRRSNTPDALPAVTTAMVVGITSQGDVLIDASSGENPPIVARTAVPIDPRTSIGASAVLAYEGGERSKPIIMGLLQPPIVQNTKCVEVEADRERLEFTADKEIVLRCGKASITLTAAGKVLIRGAYVLSRSSGVNRVKGGSVQLN